MNPQVSNGTQSSNPQVFTATWSEALQVAVLDRAPKRVTT